MSMETTCKEFAACKMSLNKNELEVLDEALRLYLVENLDSVSKYSHTGKAEAILDKLRGDVLAAAGLLLRITHVLCTAYDAEEKKEEEGA